MRDNHNRQSVPMTPRLLCCLFQASQKHNGILRKCIVPSPLSPRSIQHLVPVKKKNELWIFRRARLDVCFVATIWTVVCNLSEVHPHRFRARANVFSLVAAIEPNHRVRKIKSRPQDSLDCLRSWLCTCPWLLWSTIDGRDFAFGTRDSLDGQGFAWGTTDDDDDDDALWAELAERSNGSEASGVGRAFAAGLSKIWTFSSLEDASTSQTVAPWNTELLTWNFHCYAYSSPSRVTNIIPLIVPLSDPLFDVSTLCSKTSSSSPWRPDWSPQDVRDLRLAIKCKRLVEVLLVDDTAVRSYCDSPTADNQKKSEESDGSTTFPFPRGDKKRLEPNNRSRKQFFYPDPLDVWWLD